MASTAVVPQLLQQLPLEVSLGVMLGQQLLQRHPQPSVGQQQLLLHPAASYFKSQLLLLHED